MLDRRAAAAVLAAALLAAAGCQRGADETAPAAGAEPQDTARETAPDAAPASPAPATADETLPRQAPPPSADVRPNTTDRDMAEARPPRGGTAAPGEARDAPSPASSRDDRAVRESPAPATGSGSMREEPTPARQVERAPTIHTVPAGTTLSVEMLDGVSSKTSQAGDTFRARVANDVTRDGRVVIPQGAVLSGTVTEAKRLAKIGGRAALALEFTRIELPNGHAAVLHGTLAEQGKSETGRDVATIGGATAGGAVLGRVLSKKERDRGTAIGAVIGAAAGTVIASRTQGEEVEIPAGASLAFQLDQPADIPVR